MSKSKAYFKCKCLAVAMLALPAGKAIAGAVEGPRNTAYVKAGDAVEAWTVRRGATLQVSPGGQTQSIDVEGATVSLNGASVVANATYGVTLSLGTAAIHDSNILSTNGAALNAANGTATSGSVAKVQGSTLVGAGRGVNLTYGSEVHLSNTLVRGTANGSAGLGNGGVGLSMYGGIASITDNSTVIGERQGVVVSTTNRPDNLGKTAHLLVDSSRVQGLYGSAIVVATASAAAPVVAAIVVANGSQLQGSNGVILEAAANTTVDFTVSHSELYGDIEVDAASDTTITLQDTAMLTGNMSGVSQLHVNSGAAWNMTASTSVGGVHIDGGRINLGGTSGAFHQLTLDNLSGNGTFGLGTDLAAGEGDKLVVTGAATGNHLLAIRNTGADVAEGQDPLTVVQTGGGDAQFDAVGGQVDLGTFVYDLQQIGNEWQLVQRPGKVVTPGTRSVLGLFSAAPSVWYGELTTLRSRMGELRLGQAEGGLWTRAYGNKFNLSAGGGLAYQQQQQGFSIGADAPLPVSNGTALVGGMVGYSKSNLDLQAGTSGEVDSFYLGVYGTWLSDDGYYVDALAKFNRFQNSSDVRMSDGTRSGGDYTNHGLGVSAEAGRKIAVTQTVAVTPFAQVSALKVQGDKYTLDNGMQARSNRADSMLGKVGAKVSQTLELDAGGTLEYYAKAALAHEFASSNSVKVNDNRFSNDLSGSRGEFGVGVAAQVTDRVQLHAEFDYAKGNNMEQPWGASVGMRYSF